MSTYADIDPALRLSGAGDLVVVFDAQAAVAGIVNILKTPFGSVPMLRSFGSRLKSMLQEPMNQAQRTFFTTEFINEINRWDTRVQVSQLDFEAVPQSNTVNLTLQFVIPALGQAVEQTVPITF